MFAKSIIGSARFLRMPATSRLLYYDLGMEADDGCVEAFGVMWKTGANEDDLRVLASRGFIRVLNEDLVSFILDWGTNNQIRKDRYHAGVYKELIGTTCNVLIEDGNQVETKWKPNDNQMATEVSLGEVSLGEVREADKPPLRTHFLRQLLRRSRLIVRKTGIPSTLTGSWTSTVRTDGRLARIRWRTGWRR